MIGKLYPPYLEGTLPAFCDAKEGTVLTVPFSMNKAVNKKEVAGFYLKMKNIQSDRYFAPVNSTNYDLEKQEIYFDLTSIKNHLKVGQFYKVQIAYIGADKTHTIGYYSSVGIVKYTSKPKVYIDKLEKNIPNNHSYNYLGCYSQEVEDENDQKDYTEKVYQYRFIIKDKMDNAIIDTDWTLHNNSKDVNSYESQDEFLYIADFEKNKNYYIQYMIKTNNGLEVSSPKYRIVSRGSIDPDVKTKPKPVLNFDYGYVDVQLDSREYEEEIISHYEVNPETGEKIPIKEKIEKAVSGSFVLSRKTENGPWEELLRFALIGKKLSSWHWKDFTVEQGKNYTYALQEYNDYGLYSAKKLSNEIYVDFEDAFLFDGKRQLRIRFNPKISSFKTDYLENKIDTIGSKYPFIFRNGNVAYKEFPISGLISYQMDEENLFGFEEDFVLTEKFMRENTPAKKLEEYKVKTTNLVGYNFSAERDFKLEVLDWLNNGKPKLFRSPSEGNYIVRLLNTSLSPEDTINRLIHTFSSTAYEVAEYNYENLNKYGFISISEPDTMQTRWITIELLKESTKEIDKNIQRIELMQHKQATSVFFVDMRPGDMVYINGKSIVIGATGSYFVNSGEIIESIQIPANILYTGHVTYSFQDTAKNTFDAIESVSIKDIAAHQFIGSYDNILDSIEDIKTKVSNFYYLDFQKREVLKAYVKLDENKQYKINQGKIDLFAKVDVMPYGQQEYLIARQNIINEFTASPASYSTEADNLIKEDPFRLFQYDLPYIDIDTSHGRMTVTGFEKVQVTHENFLVEQQYLIDRYYVLNKDGNYILITQYNSEILEKDSKGNTYCYVKKPFELYYDPKKPAYLLISEDSLNRINEFLDNKEKLYGEEIYITTDFKIYSNKAYIDGEEIDLTDDIQVKINSLTSFKEIKMDAGVLLNCGYEIQILKYYNEDEIISNYKKVEALKKIIDTTYKDTFEEFYLELLKTSGLDDFLIALDPNVFLEVATYKYYPETITEAHRSYEEEYQKYLEELIKILIEREVIIN